MNSVDNDRINLLSLMLVLREKGFLSEEDYKTINDVSRLGDAVLSSGLITGVELESAGKELAEFLGYLSARIKDGSFTTREVQEELKQKAGGKFPSLINYVTKSKEGE